jgi:hypothetical protein
VVDEGIVHVGTDNQHVLEPEGARDLVRQGGDV